MLVARALAGSWRQTVSSSIRLDETELDQITPLFYGSGTAALGWWRLRGTKLSTSSSGDLLQQAYRLQTLQAAVHEQEIKSVFHLLRERGVEPLLAKGWAAANLYPERGLRPYGDIDLLVLPEHVETAKAVLGAAEASGFWVDLHNHFPEIDERPAATLFGRSRLVSLDGAEIRVLAAEDHLALLAIHLLKHGAWRPLWLCDIGAAVESLPDGFDWDVCLGTNPKRARWMACAIGLAHRLLDANIDSLMIANRAKDLPTWLLTNVLKQWDHPFPGEQAPISHPVKMSSYLRRPSGFWGALRKRWPNPILATISVNGAFNRVPRFPYQLANCVFRLAHFVTDASTGHE